MNTMSEADRRAAQMVGFELNLRQLKVFYFVAKHLSVTRAAEKLSVTQPAVTKQIDALERYCTVRLFSRTSRGLELTAAGQMLYAFVERAMLAVFEAEKSIVALRGHFESILRLGTTSTISHSMLPRLIVEHQRLHPTTYIWLAVGSSRAIVDDVVSDKLDLAIVGRVPYPDSVTVLPFPRSRGDELVVALSRHHRLANQPCLRLEDVCEEPLILREEGSSSRTVLMEHAHREGVNLNAVLESSSPQSIVSLVKGGAAVSILTRLLIQDAIDSGELAGVPFAGEGLWVQVDLVLPKRNHHSIGVKTFSALLESEISMPVRI